MSEETFSTSLKIFIHSSSATKRGEFLTPITPIAFILNFAIDFACEVFVMPQILIAIDFLEVDYLIIIRTFIRID